jgi:hypothetical protein
LAEEDDGSIIMGGNLCRKQPLDEATKSHDDGMSVFPSAIVGLFEKPSLIFLLAFLGFWSADCFSFFFQQHTLIPPVVGFGVCLHFSHSILQVG